MTERAAHLVDAVLSWAPVRQWVLTLPYRLRYQLAWNHRLGLAVLGLLGVCARTLLAFYAGRARLLAHRGSAGPSFPARPRPRRRRP